MEIKLTMLGRWDVRLGGEPTGRFRSDKVRALLAYLAVEHDRPHQRTSLAGLLWPEHTNATAIRNLTQTIVRLRHAIGDARATPPFMLVTRQTVQWNPAAHTQLDVAVFKHLAQSSALADLEAAAALYGGAFLPGFWVAACPDFDEWLTITREHLERTALEVLSTLTHAYLAGRRYTEADAAARRQLALDPWREAAHRQLMQALAGAGHRSAALAQYAACVRILHDEFGLAPDAATLALAEQIKHDSVPVRADAGVDAIAMSAAAGPRAALRQHAHEEPPDGGPFYGREHELATLSRWLLHDGCRVVALVGLGGVGKTALAAQLSRHVVGSFDVVIWRSLLNAPPLSELLRVVLGTLSDHQVAVPATPSEQIDMVLAYLRRRRCLLILDNFESIVQGGEPELPYRAGYAEYGHLLLRLGQTRHQSCMVLTSREEPAELTRLAGESGPQQGAVRVLRLRGLEHAAAESILQLHGVAGAHAAPLVAHYDGHPLALKLVADTIRDLYAGNIAAFLDEDTPIFADIRIVLDEQFARLGRLEQEVLVWLAIAREPTPMTMLQAALLGLPGRAALLEAVRSLRRRSLLELHGDGLALQNVVLEYVTDRLIAQACRELTDGELDWLTRFALLHPGAKEYVRQSQLRLIVQPIAQWLAATLGVDRVRERARQLLDALRHAPRAPGYTAGNTLNLLRASGVSLRGIDCGHLSVWQADLRNVQAPDLRLAWSDLAGTRFSDTFASITSVCFTPDGERVLAGCADGTLRLWQVRDGGPLGAFAGHAGVVWAVAISPDGRLCASGGDDHTLRVWDLETGQIKYVLHGHTHAVHAVAFNADGTVLASGSRDHTVRLWDVLTGQQVRTLCAHHDAVYALAFAPSCATPSLLASAGADLRIHVWDVASGRLVRRVSGPERRVKSLAWSPDGADLVSSGDELTPFVWDTRTWQPRGKLIGHSGVVQAVTFSADGATIVSGSFDGTLRLWDAQTRQAQRVLHGHTGWIHGIACSPDGATAASGGADQTARLWDIRRGHELHTLAGHATWIPALAFAPDRNTLLSGHWDRTVRVWNIDTGALQHTLYGHADFINSVAGSPDGVHAASGSSDHTVRVWNIDTGQQHLVLHGHTGEVSSLAFAPRGHFLASGSHDRSVRIWDSTTGQLLQVLGGHLQRVKALAVSPDGRVLMSGSQDGTVRMWSTDGWQLLHVYEAAAPGGEVTSLACNHAGSCLAVGYVEALIDVIDLASGLVRRRLRGHTNQIEALVWTADDIRLVSGSYDTTIRVWDVHSGEQQQVWQGHNIRTMALALRPQRGDPDAAPLLVSSGCDALIKVWDMNTAVCVQTLHAAGPYAGMDITGATGISDAQRAALKALGAEEATSSNGIVALHHGQERGSK